MGYFGGLPEVWASVQIAGGFAMAPVLDVTVDDLQAMWNMNVVTCFLACREAIRRFDGGGRLVNVAARPAVVPTGGMVAYSVSKAAVAALTLALSEEVKGQGVLINAILPSIIDTPANRRAMPNADFSSWPTPAELARAIVYLASTANAVTTGALVPVYGRA